MTIASDTLAATSVIDEVLGDAGYTRALRLAPDELRLLRQFIEDQWLATIATRHPDLQEDARRLGMARYHELAPRLDHQALWPKAPRILPQTNVERFKRTGFFARLLECFGPFTIAEAFHGDTHVEGLEEIYWRLVRPEAPSDVGDLHADCWFHQIMGMYGRAFPTQCFTLKIWIPVITEPGRNGLMLVPGSHLREWRHSTRWVNGQPKPQFDDVADAQLIPAAPGEALIFHERLLHGGAVNRGSHTRVSCEITLVFPSEAALRARA